MWVRVEGMYRHKEPVTRLDYCQYLLGSQINYTMTNFAEHSERFSHDAINRFLRDDHLTPREVWDNVREQVVQTPSSYLVFDDTVLDKRHAHQIELLRRQWSGNAHAIIKGIGVVTCVYVNSELDAFWVIDYRIYDPDGDGKSKLDHVADMLSSCVHSKRLAFSTVLMDSWYATTDLMRAIAALGKIYYCPLKGNRQADDSSAERRYQRVDQLAWNEHERTTGKSVKLKGFPKDTKVKLFRVVLSTQRTDYVVTNDFAQNSTSAVKDICGWRWKIEQFHREVKQITGIERCQCRKARIVRNHIGCAILVWVRLNKIATDTQSTIYRLKHGLLSDYLRQHLTAPALKMVLA